MSGTADIAFNWDYEDGDTPPPIDELNTSLYFLFSTEVYGWAEGPPTPSPSFILSDGYSDPTTTGYLSETMSGYHLANCTVSPTGDSYTATGPDLSVSGTTTDTYTGAGTGVTAQLTTNSSPIYLKLTGYTPHPTGTQMDILVGQQCTVQIANTDVLTGAGYTIVSYDWSISGTTFQDWQNFTPGSPPNLQASYFEGGAGSATASTASWYWNDPATTSETVSCSLTVTPPGGGANIVLTFSQDVTVYVPTFSASGSAGYIAPVQRVPGGDWFLEAGGLLSAGMTWSGTVTAPAGTNFGNGAIELVQLVTPSESWIYESYTPDTGSNSNSQGLDTQYPYESGTLDSSFSCSDSPYVDLSTPYLMNECTLNDQFVDYIMYLPPSGGQCVPLGYLDWNDYYYTDELGGDWPLWDGTPGAVNITSSDNLNFTPSNGWPTWTQID